MTDDLVGRDPMHVLLGTLVELRSLPPDDWLEGPLTDRAIRLDRLLALTAQLRKIQDWLELNLAEDMEDDTVVTPVGTLRRTPVNRSAWANSGSGERMRDDLAHAVAADIAMDVGTGELDPIKRNVALAALRAAYDAIPSFSEIKVAGRKRFKLRMEDYRTYSTHYTVQIEGAPDDR